MNAPQTSQTLGTLLRRLIEQLDGAVEQVYADDDLTYRARYTPLVRALNVEGPLTIRAISERTGVTHSATGQTVGQMERCGLVTLTTGRDARERIVALTPHAVTLLPRLQSHWAATERAARTLDDDLGVSLPDVISHALAALNEKPFLERIKSAAAHPPDA